jgi:hypothetical protein
LTDAEKLMNYEQNQKLLIREMKSARVKSEDSLNLPEARILNYGANFEHMWEFVIMH